VWNNVYNEESLLQEGSMTAGKNPAGLELTEEEAFQLLELCLTSPQKLNSTSERALRKLADYCLQVGHLKKQSSLFLGPAGVARELEQAGG
jgi:hypothetical protein